MPSASIPAQRWLRLAAVALVAVAVVRLTLTYTQFSETVDEPMHLSAGLQVLTEHRHTIQLQNPPMPRIVLALGPWLAGARFDSAHEGMQHIARKFHDTGRYELMLFLARAGNVVFLMILSAATWSWARRETDHRTALVALLLLTMQPSVLGHAGLATLDLAGAAGLAVSLVALSRWLELPSPRRSAVLGAAWGFAIACKLLNLIYVPLVCVAITVVRMVWSRRDVRSPLRHRLAWQLLLLPSATAFVVWASYGFSVGTFAMLDPAEAAFRGTFAGSVLAAIPDRMPLPAPLLFFGMAQMTSVNAAGWPSYLFGRISYEGWWWYFPAALALKTTLASLALWLGGTFARGATAHRRAFVESSAAALAIVLFSTTTHVDIGIRYILPVYVPLSLAGAVAATALLMRTRLWLRLAAAGLLAWHVVASAAAHPHYLAWFNPLAGHDPSRYLIDSNLDWGQDVLELRDVVEKMGIARIGLAVYGPADPALLGFPPHHPVNPWRPTRGWMAVSDHVYRMTQRDGGWTWLEGQPYRRIGSSIRLYHVK